MEVIFTRSRGGSSENTEWHVFIGPLNGKKTLINIKALKGQIERGRKVQIKQGPNLVAEGTTNGRGQLSVELADGAYELHVELPDEQTPA